jgi:PAS domain S-box-containing protein
MDTSGVYTFSNQATSKLIGYDASEIVGKNWLSFSLAKEKLEKDWNSLTSTQKGWRQKLWQVKAKNGSLIWLESTADPIFDADKKWIGYRGVDRDVTDEVMINKTKNEFISMVSHELRTPLTSIIGAMGLLKNNPQIPGDLQELITVADRNAERLLRLINDILDIEKLNLGKMQLSLKVQDLSKVVEEALKVAQSQANLAGIEIVYDKLLPNVLVNIDSDRTLQVILNLLSNAIKFSHQGSKITLSLSLRGHLVRLSIMDEGQGIDYDIQGKLFEKFIQAEAGDTKVKGTGLGLNISKGIIEQMGGTINFISEPGKGSTFFFDLPIVSHEE